ncbi:MAG: 4-(cytidine 5'-diphospho)-2-C-methyl-D-erythritol kinase [Burkholderiales bacterium]
MPQFFAPAKLNLFLHVLGRRDDGYHELESLFTLIDFGDALDIDARSDGVIRRVNGVENIPEDADLAIRAARGLQVISNTKLGADIRVRKSTPKGAGLGGGSSDAATVLLALDRLWNLNLSRARLAEIGLGLGADVPFFVGGQTALAAGVGERLTPVQIPRWWYVVVTPDVHVPTPFVFKHPNLTRNTPSLKIADFSAAILASCKNDLQAVVLKEFPAVAAALAALSVVSKKSLFGARMTGSGASVFAAFDTEKKAQEAFNQLPPGITGFVAQGLDKHPDFV